MRLIAILLCVISPILFAEDAPIRVGIIGCDTSHAVAFPEVFHNPKNAALGIKVVAAFPCSSEDIPSSKDRMPGYVEKLKGMGVEIVDSIDALLSKVDVVLVESVDGRPHLKQVMPVLQAKKPVFVDKPVGGTLADTLEIFKKAKELNVPIFSSSALRYCTGIAAAGKDEKIGDVLGCDAYSPCALESHHPDLFWYGIHGVETLFTIMGPGCVSVTRVQSNDTDVVVGVWKDARVGTFRGIRGAIKGGYGATVFGSKSTGQAGGFTGYEGLVLEIAKFFKTRVSPVPSEETIEIYAFMEAADESKRQGGKPVTLESVMKK